MAKLGKLTGPVMRSTTCLQRHRAIRLRCKEIQQLSSTDPLAEYRSTPLIRSVNVKDVLGDIQTDEAAAGSLGIEPVAMPVRSDAEIETAVATLGAEQAGLVEYSPFVAEHAGTIIASTARHNVPAIYEAIHFARRGGLIAYGASFTDMFRRAAGYVDRILRGEKPADLPVQTPTQFEMAINLKTAKALGLNVPPSLLATADEVIE
jgi:putative ABC transport system substrate-binding protein